MSVTRRTLLAAASPLLTLFAACTERFEVLIVNRRHVSVSVAVGQFRAPDFTTNPPQVFTEKEMLRSAVVELKPGEQKTLIYDSAAGGFWLQWRMLDPLPEPNLLKRMDLLRDERRIVIAEALGA